MSTLKHVKVGIVPLEAGLPIAEHTNFVLYDSGLVVLIVSNQELMSDNPRDIAEHMKVFAELEQKAYYSREAQQLLAKASNFFTN